VNRTMTFSRAFSPSKPNTAHPQMTGRDASVTVPASADNRARWRDVPRPTLGGGGGVVGVFGRGLARLEVG